MLMESIKGLLQICWLFIVNGSDIYMTTTAFEQLYKDRNDDKGCMCSIIQKVTRRFILSHCSSDSSQ